MLTVGCKTSALFTPVRSGTCFGRYSTLSNTRCRTPKDSRSPSLLRSPVTSPVFCKNVEETGVKSTKASVDTPHTVGNGRVVEILKKVVPRALVCVSLLVAMKLLTPGIASAAAKAAANATATTAEPTTFVSFVKGLVDFILHLDEHLSAIITNHGTATYAILFAIVFCETGLVLTPFLPGDSLLFASGAFAGLKKLNILYLLAVFIISAVLGDAVNYAIGSWLGEKAVNSKLVSKDAIARTEQFYEKYGGKTIVIARFVPIVRTFAPFVAGISSMSYQKFAAYNVGGALLWTFLFCGAGFFFGNLPFVEKNFSLVVLAIVAVSVLPVFFEIMQSRKEQAETAGKPEGGSATA